MENLRSPLLALLAIIAVAAVIVAVRQLWRRRPGPRRPQDITLGDYSIAIDYLQRKIRRLMNLHHLPGLVVALVDDQEVVWQEAFGLANVEAGRPATTKTVFKVGSISKIFTTLEILRLHEQGLIDLDAPITEYLPRFSIKSRFPDRRPITIRSILVHRSGLPRNGNLPDHYWEAAPDVLGALSRSLSHSFVAYPPGHRYKYSNVGFNVLGRVIEKVRAPSDGPDGAPGGGLDGTLAGGWPDYMQEKLLRPIGMNSSSFDSETLLNENNENELLAQGYAPYEGRSYLRRAQYDVITVASENLHSTIEDLSEFIRFLFRGGETEGGELIQDKSLKMMFEDRYSKPEDPQSTGLGWFTIEGQLSELAVFQSGIIQGTTSIVNLIPERKLGVILISNTEGFEPYAHSLSFEALDLMLETKFGIRQSKKPGPELIQVDEVDYHRFIGAYIANGDIVNVYLEYGQLKIHFQGREYDLAPISEATFILRQKQKAVPDLEVTFFVSEEVAGESYLILTFQQSYHTTCPKYPEVKEIPSLWNRLAGDYEIVDRPPSEHDGGDPLTTIRIQIVDNVLLLPSHMAALKPISDIEILLIGGEFDGETMRFHRGTGRISWSSHLYVPVDD
jgi:CubicO group peptidase (beta-lactamase class C family)